MKLLSQYLIFSVGDAARVSSHPRWCGLHPGTILCPRSAHFTKRVVVELAGANLAEFAFSPPCVS